MGGMQVLLLHFLHIVYVNPVRTSQETLYKPELVMLFGETVAVYCENHTEHKLYIKIQPLPHRNHITYPLQGPTA
jgi:hypothetical protein